MVGALTVGGNTDIFELTGASEPGLTCHVIRFVGGTAAVTKVRGQGAAVTYISTGVVDIDWSGNSNNPGVFVGLMGAPAFQATTPGDVKSYVGIPGVYNASTKKLRLSMYESGTLTDLAALEWCQMVVMFQVL